MKDHPHDRHVITVVAHAGRVVVRFAGEVVADTSSALCLNEAGYEAVYYVPRGDVRAAALRPSSRLSQCPFKGEARYWTLVAGGRESADAAWSYEQPLPAVGAIAGHLAFYPERVDDIDVG